MSDGAARPAVATPVPVPVRTLRVHQAARAPRPKRVRYPPYAPPPGPTRRTALLPLRRYAEGSKFTETSFTSVISPIA